MLQQTSLEAYQKVQPKISYSQQAILSVLEGFKSPLTNAEIAKLLGWAINRVTPRVLELRNKGLLVDCGVRPCTVTQNNAHQWGAS